MLIRQRTRCSLILLVFTVLPSVGCCWTLTAMPPLPFHKSTVRRNGDCFSIITTTVRAAVSSSTDTTTRSDGSSNIINQGATLLPTSEGEDNFVRASFETHGPEKILPATITSEATNKASDNIRRTIVPMDLVVGHSLIKQALEIAAVTCTSLVISGPTGSCKSVLARSMQLLLPNNVSVVHVPVTAAEDALTGSVDLERSLETGTPVFQPGVLTKADGGILVMDDINLMDVSTASVLFKALGDGCVHVEREGMSVTYKCQPLVVVATYNDAYEELREHFIDRFAMQVSTSTSEGASIADRVQGVLNVEAFVDIGSSSSSAADREEVSSSPASSSSSYVQQLKLLKQAAADEQTRRQRIVNATERFSAVQISKPQLLYLCQLATTWDCEGQRAEMFAATAARAAAALDGRLQVEAQDLTLAAKLCIVPRGRLVIVPDDAATATTTPEDSQQQKPETQPIPPPPNMVDQEEQQEDDSSEMEESQQEVEPEDDLEQKEQEPLLIPEEFMFGVDCSIAVDPRLLVFQKRALGKGRRAGKRSRKFNIDRGRFVKAIFPTERRRGRLAVGATLRAAAPHQIFRRRRQALLTRRTNDKRVVFITKDDFRIQQLKKKTGSLVIFVVDASGSMALNRMAAAKGAALTLLQEAYRSRDKIALIAFHGDSANIVVPPTKAMALTRSRLEGMPCGSKTPLADALVKAVHTGLNAVKVKQDTGKVITVVISDCRPNVPLCVSAGEKFDPSADSHSKDGAPSRTFLKDEVLRIARQIGALDDFDLLVIDTEDKFIRTGIGEELARFAGGNYHHLDRADSRSIARVVRQANS